MKTALEKFENKNMAAFQQLAMISRQEKEIKKQKKEIQEALKTGMEKYGLTSIDNDIVRIRYIAESESVSIDTKAFLAEDPELYHEVESRFNKRRKRKAYIKVTAK